MFNSGINKDIHYRVILYDDHGEIIEDTEIMLITMEKKEL